MHSSQTSGSGNGSVEDIALKSVWGQREQLRQKCHLSSLPVLRYSMLPRTLLNVLSDAEIVRVIQAISRGNLAQYTRGTL